MLTRPAADPLREGEHGEGFFPISLTVTDATLDKAMERLRQTLS